MASLIGVLLRLARAVLDNVLSVLKGQLNVVQTMVQQPLKAIVGMAAGGTVWRGDGATKFVEMVNQQFLPLAQLGGTNIDQTGKQLQQAADMIWEADKKATQVVNNLAGLFSGIYRM